MLIVSLNVSKAEFIVFRPKRKPIDFNVKKKLNGKRWYPTESVWYLGVKIDSKLNWKRHFNATATILNWANVMLCKSRDFVNADILKSMYYALFESQINYAGIIWRKNISTINPLCILIEKDTSLLSFVLLL